MGRQPTNSGILFGGIAVLVLVGVLLTYIAGAILPWLFIILAICTLGRSSRAINNRPAAPRQQIRRRR